MNTIKVCNAFSLNMFAALSGSIAFRQVTLEKAKDLLKSGFYSAVGHADTARLLSNMLEVDVECNRETLVLSEGDELLVAQYSGPRLPEGASQLPIGATIKWLHVLISK